MKRCFRTQKFRPDSLATIRRMCDIVEEYAQQDLRLTGRQLYYQFVSRDWLPNTERSYKNLLSLLADARYAGLVDWDAIEDRGRKPDDPSTWNSVEDIVEAALNQFRLPAWDDQPAYAELWVEKQALAGVLEPLAREHRAVLMVNKGYSSASAMYEAAERIDERAAGRPAVVLYLGDHDPSGEDMVRDVADRLNEFAPDRDVPIEVEKVALTMEQVRRYNPPPNPAKRSDARFAAYAEKHGTSSWEVDALPPNVLAQIVRAAFSRVVDPDALDATVERERTEVECVRGAVRAAMRSR